MEVNKLVFVGTVDVKKGGVEKQDGRLVKVFSSRGYYKTKNCFVIRMEVVPIR